MAPASFQRKCHIFRVQREHLGRVEFGNHICVELNSSIKNLGRAKVYHSLVEHGLFLALFSRACYFYTNFLVEHGVLISRGPNRGCALITFPLNG